MLPVFSDAIVPTSYYVQTYLQTVLLILLAVALLATAALAIFFAIRKKKNKK